MNRSELLKEIQMLDFALQDVILFLDLHPDNEEANLFYRNVKKQLAYHVREYERDYEMIENRSPFTYDFISYSNEPWPWERKEGC